MGRVQWKTPLLDYLSDQFSGRSITVRRGQQVVTGRYVGDGSKGSRVFLNINMHHGFLPSSHPDYRQEWIELDRTVRINGVPATQFKQYAEALMAVANAASTATEGKDDA